MHDTFIRTCIKLAQQAVEKGNQPFGACLVKNGEILLTAENTIHTNHDKTQHAEANLASHANRIFDLETLQDCTLYTSTEPCAMCSGAIYWAGIRRVVFGCSQEKFAEYAGKAIDIPCRVVFAYGHPPTEVVGPVLEEEAIVVHQGYWKTDRR
ncbi:nucleoside deaminase [Kovacikia minuta CCNUW1]|uniref:nucleoside deaminase n=1 Tax=Kovacikia minuta TaxID=2931930 RepID=UPI001CCC28DA|nr:nucleoside deaminase [Kovacikia minuta]UBF29193.1 nucleoside deaminase [Kovacikia minuta CCNUW1]